MSCEHNLQQMNLSNKVYCTKCNQEWLPKNEPAREEKEECDCECHKHEYISETHTVDGTPDMSYVTESPFSKQEDPEREDKGHSKRFIDALSHQVDLIENKLQDQEEFVDAMSRQVDKNINRLDKMDSEEKEFRKDLLNLLDEELTKIPTPPKGKKILSGLGLISIELLRKKYT